MVHGCLYSKNTTACVNIADYIHDLLEQLKKSFDYEDRPIKIEMKADDVLLDGDTATHFGVLFNEVVTNTFKHAFHDNPSPFLGISIQKQPRDTLHLVIKDNGCGLKEDIDPKHPQSFGMQVIQLMVEDQLDGSFQFSNKGGTHFSATLKYTYHENFDSGRYCH